MSPLRPATFAASGSLERAEALVVPVFSGQVELPGLEPGWVTRRGFEGSLGQCLAVPAAEAPTLVALGLGPQSGFGPEPLRRAAAGLARAAEREQDLAVDARRLLTEGGLDPLVAGQALAEGFSLGGYRFERYKGSRSEHQPVHLVLCGPQTSALAAGLQRGAVVAEAVAWARDLANEPPGALTPGRLGELALELAGGGMSVEVWDEGRIVAEGLGGLAGVAQGSSQPPRLLRLEYRPERDAAGPALALVGKGITFDSGGLSLKSAESMVMQKTDMSGAAAVLATMATLGRLGAASPVLGLVPTAENMPGPGALKPGDVVRARNGKTIEVVNTDAEGRLILADALCLAVEAGASAVVDLATLTGACVAALGNRLAGLMGNDQSWVAQVKAAADRAGEPTWILPLPDDYRCQLDSEVADMKNVGRPGQAGALVAGLVLSEFASGVPWAHIDMAGPARSDTDDGYLQKGATGFGVRTLLELAAPPRGVGELLSTTLPTSG